jgi:hypothetical protein
MSPLPVIENLDVFAYGTLGLCASREIPMVNHLRLQASPEAFHRRIIEAIAFTRHRNPELKLPQKVLVLFSAILTSTIRMVNDSGKRTVLLNRSEQRPPGQLRLHAFSHGITDDLARKDVLDPGQIQPALTGGEWSERPGVVELFPGLSSPNRTCTSQRIRLSVSSVAHSNDEISVTRFEDMTLLLA